MINKQHVVYTNHKSLHKQLCRDFLFKEIVERFPDRATPLRVCTLSNTCYVLERKIIEHYPNTQLFLVEHCKPIFKEISFHWAGTPVNVLYGNLLEILSYNLQYEVIWADMCSPITGDIIDVFSNTLNMQRDCIFSCTLLMAREAKNLAESHGFSGNLELRDKFSGYISKQSNYEKVFEYLYHSGTVLNCNPFRFTVFSKKQKSNGNKFIP